jgi:predicted O-methyltransferase YrrM
MSGATEGMPLQPHAEPLFRFGNVSVELRAELDDICLEIPIDEGGGSSLTKMLVLAELAIRHDVQRAAEIGVYRGRIFLALAATMRALGRGEVIGIDPYTAEAAIQRDDHKVGIDLREWPQQVDWEDLYDGVVRQVQQRGLETFCRLERRTSADAATEFSAASFQLLHIDGNHDHDAVASDLELYLPRMRLGGLVAMDDVSWPSIQPLFREFAARHELVLQVYDPGTFSTFDDFGIVRIINDVNHGDDGASTAK